MNGLSFFQVREKLIEVTKKRQGMVDQWETRWEYLQLSKSFHKFLLDLCLRESTHKWYRCLNSLLPVLLPFLLFLQSEQKFWEIQHQLMIVLLLDFLLHDAACSQCNKTFRIFFCYTICSFPKKILYVPKVVTSF